MGVLPRIAVAVAIGLVCVHSRPARAQSAEGEALFREGKRLIKAGKLAEGCEKIEASERIESSTGTLLNLGDCLERLDRLASAWAAFAKAAASAKRDNDLKREAEARRRAKLLDPRLAKLTIVVKARVDGLEIRRDEQLVDAGLWSVETPVDAGSYKITASAPGYKPWGAGIVAIDGQVVTVEVPALVRDPAAPAPPAPRPEPRPEVPGDEIDDPAPPRGTFTTLRKVSLGLGLVGAAGLAYGVYAGLRARDLRADADAICPEAACSDPAAVATNRDAQAQALRANIGFVVGGAAIAGAVVLWLIGAPSGPAEQLAIVPAPGGAVLSATGRF